MIAADPELLHRVRHADPNAGIWEAADRQWWWRTPRSSDAIEQLFWVEGLGEEVVGAERDGAFEIRVASRSRAGNWLPTGGIERYALMLRLYDTPVGVATRTQRDAPMPTISTVGCP